MTHIRVSVPRAFLLRVSAPALLVLFLAAAGGARAQISIGTLSVPVTEDFLSVGTAQVATLPAGWKMDKNTTVRLVGSYAAAGTETAQRAGDNMSSTATNGIYNSAAGDPTTAADRALGFISSSSGTKSGNLYAWYQNNTGSQITSLTISYNVEKYRAGSNAAGFSYQLYYSTDGATWTTAGASFLTSFAADAANAGYASAPGATVPATGVLVLTIPAGNSLYLAWNYSVTSGTTTSNAQGLGIDDVAVLATGGSSLPTTVQFTAASSAFSEAAGTVGVSVGITNFSGSAATTVDVALTGGTATNGVDVVPAYSTQTVTFPSGSGADQTVYFTIADDAVYEGNETLVFSLQNPTGGNTASISGQNTHTVTMVDNETPPPPDAIVSEYFNANGDLSSYEAVELYVVKDGLDMRGWSLADGTSGGTYPYGSITFSNDPLWSSLQAGTIIVVGGLFSVPFADTDPSDGLIMVQSPSNGATNQYFTAGSSVPSIAGASDAVALRDATATFVHGLAHGAANQLTLPAGRHGWYASSISNGRCIGFTRGTGAMTLPDFLVNTYVADTLATLGNPNDALGNRDFLRAIRSRSITASRTLAGTFFWNVTVNAGTVTMNGPVTVGNNLALNEGSLVEGGFGLRIDGAGNAQNGTGAGTASVGDNAGAAALLSIASASLPMTGSLNAAGTEATVEYRGAMAQAIVPAPYNNLTLLYGDASTPKTLDAAASVAGALTIGSNAVFSVTPPVILTLGPSGVFANSGRFLGSIQSTRSITTATAQAFGGIGLTIAPTGAAYPGATTVTMTSGAYRWVGNLPSILRYYTVAAASGTGNAATVTCAYDHADLNGQTESGLALQRSADGGATWGTVAGTLNTTANTIAAPGIAAVNGIWTMHANPPQGRITADKVSLAFEAEQDYTLPAPQQISVANANSAGSIIEWTATAASTPSWLSLTPSPATGVNAGSFLVSVTRTDLAPGVYAGTVTIADPHAVNNPLVIPVEYRVQAPRAICVGTDTIVITARVKYGSNPRKSVVVMNCGGTFGADLIAWSVVSNAPWLTVAPVSGMEGEAFTLTGDIWQRPPGSTLGSITITGTHSLRGTPIANSPLTIPVRLQVEQAGPVAASTGPLPVGQWRTLYTPLGHRAAQIRVNAGNPGPITMRMFPDELPSGISRLRYAMRYFLFECDGSGYNVDVRLFYANTELQPMLVDPAALLGWRQYPVGGVWHPTTSAASAIDNAVTITGITDLRGAWCMASTYFPFAMPMRRLGARWTDAGEASVEWSTDLRPSSSGFLVQRSARDRNQWAIVGIVPANGSGDYSFLDGADSRLDYDYRLLAIADDGSAFESPEVALGARGSTSACGATQPGELALEPTPNPVVLGLNAGSTMSFTLPRGGHAAVTVYDSYGRVAATLADGDLAAGSHTAFWNAAGSAAGSYYVVLQFEGRALTRKVALIR
jgi:hypothetical protein